MFPVLFFSHEFVFTFFFKQYLFDYFKINFSLCYLEGRVTCFFIRFHLQACTIFDLVLQMDLSFNHLLILEFKMPFFPQKVEAIICTLCEHFFDQI